MNDAIKKELTDAFNTLKGNEFMVKCLKAFGKEEINKEEMAYFMDLLEKRGKKKKHKQPLKEIVKDTPYIHRIVIKEPIWKNQSVGLAEDKLTEETEVEISYTDKAQNKPFPHLYSISKTVAKSYPSQLIHGHTVRIIPIADLDIKTILTL